MHGWIPGTGRKELSYELTRVKRAREKTMYEMKYVAFVDILGFQSKISAIGTDDKGFDKVLGALGRILEQKKDNESDTILNNKDLGVEVTTFSDCMVISWPAELDNLIPLIVGLIHLQIDLAENDILLRGGVVQGQVYHNDNEVFGPAMNLAYQYESKVAFYPRIIVDADVVKNFRNSLDNEADIHLFDGMVKKDFDGFYYIDMLSQDQEFNNPECDYLPWLQHIRSIVVEGLKNENFSVQSKYQWLKMKLNSLVTDEHACFPYPEGEMYDDIDSCRSAYLELEIVG